MTFFRHFKSVPLLSCVLALLHSTATADDLKLLFMGDNGHHRPSERFHELAPVMDARGIELKYTDRMEDLTAETLADFDGLVLFANIDKIEDAREKAFDRPLFPPILDMIGATVPTDALAKVQRRLRMLDRGPAGVRRNPKPATRAKRTAKP